MVENEAVKLENGKERRLVWKHRGDVGRIERTGMLKRASKEANRWGNWILHPRRESKKGARSSWMCLYGIVVG